MADLIFLNVFSPVEKETDLTRNQVGSDGDPTELSVSNKVPRFILYLKELTHSWQCLCYQFKW